LLFVKNWSGYHSSLLCISLINHKYTSMMPEFNNGALLVDVKKEERTTRLSDSGKGSPTQISRMLSNNTNEDDEWLRILIDSECIQAKLFLIHNH
jgi:hypothetical protein